MKKTDVIKALTLMASYWNNFKMPSSERDVDVAAEAWLMLLGSVSADEVNREIAKQAASGREFTPNVGQIYAGIKSAREAKQLIAPMSILQKETMLIMQKCRAAGLPTALEAHKQGVGLEDWEQMCEGVI